MLFLLQDEARTVTCTYWMPFMSLGITGVKDVSTPPFFRPPIPHCESAMAPKWDRLSENSVSTTWPPGTCTLSFRAK